MADNHDFLRATIVEDLDNASSEVNAAVLVSRILGKAATKAELIAGNAVVTALLDGRFECKAHNHGADRSEIDEIMDGTGDEELIKSVIADIAANKEIRERPDIYG